MIKLKSILKHLLAVPVLIVVVLSIPWLITGQPPEFVSTFNQWWTQRSFEKMANAYKTDNVGGKTPEETYDMLIVALKAGNTKLASKYFVIEDQEKWKEDLEKHRDAGTLDEFVNDLENTRRIWKKVYTNDKNIIGFKYHKTIRKGDTTTIDGVVIQLPIGNTTNETELHRYPTNVWKIMHL